MKRKEIVAVGGGGREHTIGICLIKKQVQNTPISAFPHPSLFSPRTSTVVAPVAIRHRCKLASSRACVA